MLWPRKLLILQKAQTVTFALKAEARYISGTSRIHTLASTSRSGSENQRKVFSKSIKTTLSGIWARTTGSAGIATAAANP